jgi:hypothetical protein
LFFTVHSPGSPKAKFRGRRPICPSAITVLHRASQTNKLNSGPETRSLPLFHIIIGASAVTFFFQFVEQLLVFPA